jgi:hypothetical protein
MVLIAEALAGVLCLALLGAGLKTGEPWLLAAGGLGLVIVIAVTPLGLLLARAAEPRGADRESLERLRDLGRAIERFGEQAALSDDARRVLNRQRERELLRAAIEEDIGTEDWDAAMVLVKELAERFGYRSDAEEFRQRIEQARFETVERRVIDAVSRLDGLIMQRRWEQAFVEAARTSRLFPDSPRVEGLRHRVEQARLLYKSDLERRFLNAAKDGRIDEAMTLLKELDAYLGEQEAEPFREVARGVIGKARENLGVEFKLAVQDRRWVDAAIVGERIIEEFPNSRMAQEVRGMLDGIRARASGNPPVQAAG